MARLTLTVLGGFAVQLDPGPPITVPGRKAQGLLAYLALHAGHPQPRDKVTALLWGDTQDRQARLSLRQVLFQIRRSLGAAAATLTVEGDALGLDPAGTNVDARDFERLANLSTPEALAQAADLYRGELLEGLIVDEGPWEEWLTSERQRLHELALEVFARLLRHEMEAKHDDRATQTALRLLALDPLQEPVHRALMRLYERQGRSAAALRQYQSCTDLLQRELGTEPEPDTRQLYAEILRRHRIATSPPPERPLGATSGAPGRTRSRGRTSLVGRAAELAAILAVVSGAEGESGRLVLVTGEAGIGKTRVVEEVGAAAERDGRRVIFAGCHRTEQVLPLRPLADALRAAGTAARRDLVEALTPRLRVEISRLLPELAEPGFPPAAEAQRLRRDMRDPVRLFEAAAELLGVLAALQPLAIVIEDLHWADEMTLRFLGFLGRRLAGVPVILLGTARDDELDDSPTLRMLIEEVEHEGLGLRVVLPALSRGETTELVRLLWQGRRTHTWTKAVVSDVWSASRGNPFVIEESVRTLQERRGRAKSSKPVLPERVRELTATRLARLSEPGRHVVAVAAVAGEPVTFGFLAEAAAMEERQTAEVVEELVRRRMLEIAEEGLDFTHDRIRRVAYERLLPARRQSLHAAVAQVLEARNADHLEEVCDRLAHHYGMARNAERAIRYLVLFAQTARTRYALAPALSALDQALRLIPALPSAQRDRRTLDIVLEKAFVLSLMAELRGVVTLLAAHQERMEAFDDPRLAGEFHFRLALTQLYLGEVDASERTARRALAAAQRRGDRLAAGLAHYILSIIGTILAPMAGVEHGQQAIDDLSAAQTPFWLGFGHYVLGANLVFLGDLDAARRHLMTAIDLGRAVHDIRLESLALGWLASAECLMGATDAAIAAADRALTLAPDAFARVSVMTRRAWIHLENGDPGAARRDLEAVLEEAERREIFLMVGRVKVLLADALQSEDRDAAIRMAEDAIAHNAKLGARWDEAWGWRVLGRAAHAGGDLASAEHCLRASLAAFDSIGALLEVARTKLAMSEVLHARGHRSEAARLVAEAGERFQALKMPAWLERAQKLSADLAARGHVPPADGAAPSMLGGPPS